MILKKLLTQNRNTAQVIGAAIGAFIGLFLLLFALQTWFDLQKILRGASEGENYVILNKPVSLANTIFGKSVFKPEETKDIGSQSFTKAVANFSANRFKVSASSSAINFYTELFFESVPKEHLDVEDPEFRWREGQTEIPIIMSKDYLALYNFGFAISQGLPQFTPSTIRKVNFDINLRGKGQEKTFTGRIIGFSNRINSILVPESFMSFANDQFGDQPDLGASRILLKVENPYDKKLATYLNEKGYELSTGRLIGGRLGTILNATIAALAIIGILLMLLSTLVFVLNYQLIISKSAADIRLLRQIGYRPTDIARVLRGSLFKLLGSIFIIVIAALFAARIGVVGWLEQQDFAVSKTYDAPVLLIGLVLMSVILVVNILNIKRQVLAN
ncbi:MAG: hypothetical protein JNL70_12535 [Saprospiraceae bacterium]|nr:hypothetical protein [Saprospiraceae bacterium]